MSELAEQVLVCRPNINAAGRRRRRRFGYAAFAVAAAMLLGFVAFAIPGAARAFVFLPITGGMLSLLQARRNT